MSVVPADDGYRLFEPVPERTLGLAKSIHDALLAAGWTVYASQARYGYSDRAPLRVWYLPPGQPPGEFAVGYALMTAAAKQIEAEG